MNVERFQHINDKMNRITQEITKNVNLSEDLLTSADEIAEYLNSSVTETTQIIPRDLGDVNYANDEIRTLAPVTEIAASVVDIQAMQEDFNYMRNMLRETTQNSKRVLNSVTEELLLSDGESRAQLVVAFSELNKAQIESVKLFMQSYKEVSTILVNLSKLNNQPHTVHTTNVLNIEDTAMNFSPADIVNRLRGDR